MKYYVYAGYYENFISGHKLPKPYILRDEFKTFDEALDYVWENWEDDDIFFTEDVIDDAIDNGVIDDENWEDYLMEESKKSARKSLKEDSLDDIIPMGHSEYFDTLVEFFKDNDVPIRISHTANGGKICYVENDMEFITVIFKSPKRGYELLKTIEMYADGSTYLSRGKGGAWHSNHIPLEEVYVWDMDKDKFVNYKGKVLTNIDYNDIVESKKSARKSLREMFGNEGIVDDFVDFLIYDCGYDEKTVKKYFYKKYKLNGLDVIPIKLYIQIKNEIEDVLGYNDIM